MARTTTSAALALALALAGVPAAAEPRGWEPIAAIGYEESEGVDAAGEPTWSVRKTYPPEIAGGAEGYVIAGHLVRVEPQARLTRFLLVPDPSTCPFCGDGGYGPTLEVTMRRPLPDLPEGTLLTLRGRLVLVDDPESYRAVELEDAVRIDPAR